MRIQIPLLFIAVLVSVLACKPDQEPPPPPPGPVPFDTVYVCRPPNGYYYFQATDSIYEIVLSGTNGMSVKDTIRFHNCPDQENRVWTIVNRNDTVFVSKALQSNADTCNSVTQIGCFSIGEHSLFSTCNPDSLHFVTYGQFETTLFQSCSNNPGFRQVLITEVWGRYDTVSREVHGNFLGYIRYITNQPYTIPLTGECTLRLIRAVPNE